MTLYQYDMQLAEDPDSIGYVARNADITFYNADDTTNTTPLSLFDPNGLPQSNPVLTTADGFIRPLVSEVPQMKWVSTDGRTGYLKSFKGVLDAALAAVANSLESLAQNVKSASDAEAARDAAAAAAASAANASGGSALSPDPNNPGLWFFTPGGQITPDPNAEGIYVLGASA